MNTDIRSAWVCVVEGQTIGFVVYQIMWRTVWIHNLVVFPGYQDQGIEERLINTVLEQFKKNINVGTCKTRIRASHTKTLKLFFDIGFTKRWRQPNWYSNPAEDGFLLIYKF